MPYSVSIYRDSATLEPSPVQREANVSSDMLNELSELYRDPEYWTMSISFTATTAQRAVRRIDSTANYPRVRQRGRPWPSRARSRSANQRKQRAASVEQDVHAMC
jgi:hypothetical protein